MQTELVKEIHAISSSMPVIAFHFVIRICTDRITMFVYDLIVFFHV